MSAGGPRVTALGEHMRLVHGRHGHLLCNAHDRYVGQSLIRYGEFSELEWDVLKQLCHPGHVVAEVGANIGSHTVAIAKAVGPRGRVLAFEPQPAIFRTLCANVALNELYNVECFQMGLGAAPERITIPHYNYATEGNFGGIGLDQRDPKGVPVEINTLDALFAGKRLNMLKLDVEGMEAEVLKGARDTIARCRPFMYVENDRRDRSPALITLVLELGYRAWWHRPRLYNPANFFGEAENAFGNIVSINMFCTPAEHRVEMHGFAPVENPDDRPPG
ncbi:MAG: FkbM family methyltransferase [Alphaproteobacteria bacterium]|nr:FkbM family methyltransferase [Alphaproteobacteria bacterium]